MFGCFFGIVFLLHVVQYIFYLKQISKRKYTFLDKCLGLSFPAQMCHCTMPKVDAG